MVTDVCKFCERDFCDTDCLFADRNGQLDRRGETIPGSHQPRKTAAEFRAEGRTSAQERVRELEILLERTLALNPEFYHHINTGCTLPADLIEDIREAVRR